MRKRKEAGKDGTGRGGNDTCLSPPTALGIQWFSGLFVSYEGHKTVQDPHVEGQACPLKRFS